MQYTSEVRWRVYEFQQVTCTMRNFIREATNSSLQSVPLVSKLGHMSKLQPRQAEWGCGGQFDFRPPSPTQSNKRSGRGKYIYYLQEWIHKKLNNNNITVWKIHVLVDCIKVWHTIQFLHLDKWNIFVLKMMSNYLSIVKLFVRLHQLNENSVCKYSWNKSLNIQFLRCKIYYNF